MLRSKASSPGLKLRDVDFDIKAADGDGYTLKGYGSVFGVKDSYGEVVEKGAFVESIATIKAKGRKLPMLWQHRSAEPIGVWEKMVEDREGLYLEGSFLKGVQVAEEARIRALAGAVTGLSIGYYVRDSGLDEVEKVVRLKKLDLIETSLVTFPANDDARIDAVKFQLMHGGFPELKDFERFLRREAGLSKSQAALVVTRGYAELLRREAGSDDENDTSPEVKGALSELAADLAKPLFS